MVAQVRAMLEMHKRGAIVFDYGTNLRGQALEAGEAHAMDFPGFVPAYIRPLFCRGKGPFRWVALSGDPEDIYRIDEAILELFPLIVADGTPAAAKRLERVLTNDPGTGVMRHVDASYEEARACAQQCGVKIPMWYVKGSGNNDMPDPSRHLT